MADMDFQLYPRILNALSLRSSVVITQVQRCLRNGTALLFLTFYDCLRFRAECLSCGEVVGKIKTGGNTVVFLLFVSVNVNYVCYFASGVVAGASAGVSVAGASAVGT